MLLLNVLVAFFDKIHLKIRFYYFLVFNVCKVGGENEVKIYAMVGEIVYSWGKCGREKFGRTIDDRTKDIVPYLELKDPKSSIF